MIPPDPGGIVILAFWDETPHNRTMKYLGIDYGAKRVGIAVSDEGGKIAFPRTTVPNDAELMAHIRKVIQEEQAGAIVMGDTKSHGGAANSVSAQADAFAAELSAQTGLTVERSWELWSTMEVSKLEVKGHEHDDAAAAAFILQRFLDMRANQSEV
jgi:putative Holliday junction resolvase